MDLDLRKPVWDQVKAHPLIDTKGMSEVEVDRAYGRVAKEKILASPLTWIKARAKQFPLLFADIGQYFFKGPGIWKLAVMGSFLLGNFVFVLTSFSGLWLLRKRFFELAYITAFPVYLTLIHLPLWVEARYSLPMTPMLSILSAYTIHQLYLRVRANRS